MSAARERRSVIVATLIIAVRHRPQASTARPLRAASRRSAGALEELRGAGLRDGGADRDLRPHRACDRDRRRAAHTSCRSSRTRVGVRGIDPRRRALSPRGRGGAQPSLRRGERARQPRHRRAAGPRPGASAAHRHAADRGLVGPELEAALRRRLRRARRVRRETRIAERPVSIAAAALDLARDIHGDLAAPRGAAARARARWAS